MTNGELDDFIIGRWQRGHTVPAIRQQLLMPYRDFPDARILAAIRRYIDDASENVKINREKLWIARLRKALRRFQ